MYVLQIVVCFQWCSCYLIFSFMYVLQIVVCLQWCTCYQIFSLYVCFVDRCLSLVVFVLLDLQFICMFCRSLFVFSGVRVTRSLVYMYVLQIVVCFQWCTCYQIFSFICMFCRSLFVFRGVRVTRSLVEQELPTLPEHLSSPPGFQWSSCYQIFSFMCNVLQIVVCFQWCSCYQIFSLYVCFVGRCLFLVVHVLLDLQFICMFCRSLFVFSGVRVTRSLVLCVMFCRSLFVFSGVRVT